MAHIVRMRRVKQLNKWVIKEYSDNLGVYAVFSPDGRMMEDNLNYNQAEEFCRGNLDFVKVPRSGEMMFTCPNCKNNFSRYSFRWNIRKGMCNNCIKEDDKNV